MPQNITTHVQALVEAAEREIETLSADAAIALHGRDEVVFVDLRDIRELNREGRVPGAFHCPRGMLEFWIDPREQVSQADLRAGQALRVLLRGRPALGAGDRRPRSAWGSAGRPYRRRLRRLEGGRRAGRGAEPTQDVRRIRMALELIIGNKNYSSWSLRPWIAMKVAGIAFEEEVISLDAKDFKERVTKVSGTGKVPALVDGNVQVWESLAILEYLAEKFPAAGLWPADPAARAQARAIAAEMHAGFVPLRRHLPMNMWRPVKPRELAPEVQSNVRRIEAMWTDCRNRFGAGGSVPVRRLRRRRRHVRAGGCRASIPMGSRSARWRAPIWRRSWRCRPGASGGRRRSQEPWVLAEDEVDWPTVLRV